MAIGKRKTVVVYTALAVVIGTATIIGVLALTGKINLRIRADEAVPASGVSSFDSPHKQWTLRANPCNLAGTNTNALPDILGGNYLAYYDNNGSWVGGESGQNQGAYDIKYDAGNGTLKRGYAYWVYNRRTGDNEMWWAGNESVPGTCNANDSDNTTQGDTVTSGTFSLTLPTGKALPIGSPYLLVNTSLKNIKVFVGTDGTSLYDLLVSQAPEGNNAVNKKVKLMFYDRSSNPPYKGYETLTGLLHSDGPLECFPSGDNCATTNDQLDALIKPGQAFYIAFAPSIGSEVRLEFTKL